jgi:hypothetical protein
MDIKATVYSRNTLEFVTVAKEFCSFMESCESYSTKTFVTACSKLLPLLYYKAALLSETTPIYDEGNEQFVTENDYMAVLQKVEGLLGQHNEFAEINDQQPEGSFETTTASIAEYIADIYQDLKNFVMRYQLGKVEVMNDAIWECYENFGEYWGVRLAALIRAFHALQFGNVDLENIGKSEDSKIDTSSWFITRRQNDSNPIQE